MNVFCTGIQNPKKETELMDLYNKENASATIKNTFDLGRARGFEQGFQQGVKKVVLEMLRKGTPTEFIAEVTHLEKEGNEGHVTVKVG